MPLAIAEAQSLWSPELVYLNTASFGLPPRPAWEALQAALEDWRGGRTSWEHWDAATEEARARWARLVGVDASSVAVASTVSGLIGLVAASSRTEHALSLPTSSSAPPCSRSSSRSGGA